MLYDVRIKRKVAKFKKFFYCQLNTCRAPLIFPISILCDIKKCTPQKTMKNGFHKRVNFLEILKVVVPYINNEKPHFCVK